MSNQNLPTMADLRDFYETSGVFDGLTKHLLWKEMTPSMVHGLAVKYIQETTDLNGQKSFDLIMPIFDWVESFYEDGEFALSQSSKRRLKIELQNGGGW